jgi:hypothetical protein
MLCVWLSAKNVQPAPSLALGYFANFGIWGFCQNFLQKYYDSLKRDSIFGEAPQWFLGGPKNQIWLFGE